jgi:hypothetical protein
MVLSTYRPKATNNQYTIRERHFIDERNVKLMDWKTKDYRLVSLDLF